MNKIWLVFLLSLALLSACASSDESADAKGAIVPQTPTSTPADAPAAPPTPTSSPSEPQAFTPAPYLQTADLTGFTSAWNSHNVENIRSLYTADARYFPEQELANLEQGQSIDVFVSDQGFEERLHKIDGLTLRILGDPLQVYDKLVAFAYRWENASNGYDGVALLRLEGDRIFLHADLLSAQPTPNQPDVTGYFNGAQLDGLMQAWNEADLEAARLIYSPDAIILSDEDLAQAPWRDFTRPPRLEELLPQFSGWDPRLLGKPLRIGDFVIFAWHWNIREYPAGYGVRMLQYDGSAITSDVRFAIRPWEAGGKSFMNP